MACLSCDSLKTFYLSDSSLFDPEVQLRVHLQGEQAGTLHAKPEHVSQITAEGPDCLLSQCSNVKETAPCEGDSHSLNLSL